MQTEIPLVIWTDHFDESWPWGGSDPTEEQLARQRALDSRRVELMLATMIAEHGLGGIGKMAVRLLRSEWIIRAAWNAATGSRLPL